MCLLDNKRRGALDGKIIEPNILFSLVDQKSLHITVLANVQFFLQYLVPIGGIFRQYLFSRLV